MEGAAGTIKRVTLELGGKSANVVFADADLEQGRRGRAVRGLRQRRARTAARARASSSRSRRTTASSSGSSTPRASVKVGDPAEESTEMGPLISAEHREKVASFVEGEHRLPRRRPGRAGVLVPVHDRRGLERRPRRARGGLRPGRGDHPVRGRGGRDPHRERHAVRSLRARSGRATPPGHSASTRAIDAGVLSVNANTSVSVQTPFGGFKQSGFGRELGLQALDGYSELKSVFISTEE